MRSLAVYQPDPDRPSSPDSVTQPAQDPPSSPLTPSPPSPVSSLDSSSSSFDSIIMSAKTDAIFLGDAKRQPTVANCTVIVAEFVQISIGVARFIRAKALTEDEKKRDVWMNVWTSGNGMRYFEKNRTALLAMTEAPFKHAILEHAVGADWQEDVSGAIISMRQETVDKQDWTAVADEIEGLNDLLVGTKQFYSDESLRAFLLLSMTDNFRRFCKSESLDNSLPFLDWRKHVSELDAKFRVFEKDKIEKLQDIQNTLAKRPSKASHYGNDQPRSHLYTPLPPDSRPQSRVDDKPTAPAWSVVSQDASQVQLCNDGKMCRRCRNFYAGHFAVNCTHKGPVFLTVAYRKLTNDDLAFARRAHEATNAPITLDAVLKYCKPGKSASVAAVQEAAVTDLASILDNAPTSSSSSMFNHIAAVFGNDRVTHIADGPYVCNRTRLNYATDTLPFDAPMHAVGPNARITQDLRPIAAMFNDGDDFVSLDSDGDDSPDEWSGIDAPAQAHIEDVEVSAPVSPPPPLRVAHMFWNTTISGPNLDFPEPVSALIDDGAHLVLIRNDLVTRCGLQQHKLASPIPVSLAMNPDSNAACTLTEYVKLSLRDPVSIFRSRTVYAVISEDLCAPIILRLPFLAHNGIVVDHQARTAIVKGSTFDLLNPKPPGSSPELDSRSPKGKRLDIFRAFCNMRDELKHVLRVRKVYVYPIDDLPESTFVASVKERVEFLSLYNARVARSEAIKADFRDVFDDIPHVDELPTDITVKISLKESHKMIQSRNYVSPRKYAEAWQILIDKHLAAGRIRRSSSEFSSAAFLVPKADPTALPRWVNDYRALNANTVPDRHPLPRIEDILADCAKGKVFGKMDMTDSFFQTRCEESTIPMTAVNTLLGMYEWLVMPQGLRNAPAVQQRRVTKALREYIGKFCHVYLDDIIIWSQNDVEHEEHVRLILAALRHEKLYCNPKKCVFFQDEIDFLGYHVSARGVEAQDSKCESVLNFPRPTSAEETRRFLGLVRFIAGFLDNLADHTRILTPLTKKECNKNFPDWTLEHEAVFVKIKELVTSRAVLTTIDHAHPGENKIFLTCDASDWRTGAILSWGPDLKSARPVAFDSKQLSGPELCYAVHEKELLAIVRTQEMAR